MKKASGILMLLLTALIWGTAFVAQRTGMDHVGPITFQSVRSLLGVLALTPLVLLRKKRQGKAFRMPSLRAALVCGLVLGLASTLQQVGLQTTQAGKAGFLSALYVILVPIFGVLLRRRLRRSVWLGVLLSFAGVYLMSSAGAFSFAMTVGEMWVLLSAVLYAGHILVVDYFAAESDGVALSCMQFLVAGAAGFLPMLVFERPALLHLWEARGTLLYTGILSSGVAYTLQILGQKHTPPAAASLIMSLESVFAAVSGWLLLGESMAPRELCGSALMLAAVVLSQLPERRRAS